MMEKNVSLFDRTVSRIVLWGKWAVKGINYSLIMYPVIRNWYSFVLYRAAFVGEPKVEFRKKLKLPFVFRLLTGKFEYSRKMIEGHYILFRYGGRDVKLFYDTDRQLINTLELIKDQFIGEEYGMLDFVGRQVVDIGANIGDTAVYFALNGARHVYSIEPYPYSFGIATKNIRTNGLSEKVTLLNQCCGARSGSVLVDEKFQNDERSPMVSFKSGKRIPVVTLGQIVKRYRLREAVLKIDCEGDEYGLILGASRETLRKFEQIVIEYHYGFRNLEKKLRQAGFKVRCDLPSYGKNPTPGMPGMYYGLIFAQLEK
ncbi:MAG: FkbM family methyltransferase [Candidatus Micrarchaeota archaeon]|nr:FkbM family methyltransferase [Candidatus Micrarchaeota archaeon]